MFFIFLICWEDYGGEFLIVFFFRKFLGFIIDILNVIFCYSLIFIFGKERIGLFFNEYIYNK